MLLNWELIGAASIAIGLLLGLIALPWLLVASIRARMGRTSWQGSRRAVSLLGAGLLLATVPLLANQILLRVLDLGPLETMVAGERHITLTGWDRHDYSILLRKPDVVVLQLANADVTDETLKLLAGMSQLKELDLNHTAVTDAGLELLAKLPKLESLRLKNTKITDAGFRTHLLEKASLVYLDLTGTEVASKTVREWKKNHSERKALK